MTLEQLNQEKEILQKEIDRLQKNLAEERRKTIRDIKIGIGFWIAAIIVTIISLIIK